MSISMAENLTVYQKAKGDDAELRVEDYIYLVKRIAHHMMARMPSSVQVEDLIQAGMVGLLEAVQKYDGEKGASFETYAGIRIRGSIVDEMRRGDWAPRSVHRNSRRIAEAISIIESRTGRDARDHEIAAELGVSLAEYFDMAKDSASTRLFSLDETYDDDDQSVKESVRSDTLSPAETTQENALRDALAQAINKLPEKEKLVLSLYYDQELNLKEIGLVLGVSESRVSQIHSQAALRLKSKLSVWHTDDD